MTKTEFNAIVNRIREAKVAMLDVDSYLYPTDVAALEADQARAVVQELDMLRTIAMNTRVRVHNRVVQHDDDSLAGQLKRSLIIHRERRVR